MSKQYLQSHTLPSAHKTDIFSLATTPIHLISASGASSLKVHSIASSGSQIHPDSGEDENPFPLVQELEKAHPLGCHHVCAASEGKVMASVGFDGDVRVWEEREGEGWWLRGSIKGMYGVVDW